MTKEKLVLLLNKIGAVKFGQFKLKSGLMSPIYINLRDLVSYPKALHQVAKVYWQILKKLSFKRMVAVPYAAMPIVGAISFISNKPWVYLRKKQKDYGLKKMIEGEYKKGEKVVVIDDLITTGLSKIETIKPILGEGLKVKDVVVLIDRGQGGRQDLKKRGYVLHSYLTLDEIAEILWKKKKISQEKYNEVISYLRS